MGVVSGDENVEGEQRDFQKVQERPEESEGPTLTVCFCLLLYNIWISSLFFLSASLSVWICYAAF